MTHPIILKIDHNEHVPTIYKISRGAYGPDAKMNFVIQDENEKAYDITGKTLEMVLYEIMRKIPIIEKELTHVSSTDGTAEYEPDSDDFNLLKEYYMKVSLEDSNGKIFTEEAVLIVQ